MKWDRHRGLSPQLGMQELPGQTVIASLTNYLRDKRLLLDSSSAIMQGRPW